MFDLTLFSLSHNVFYTMKDKFNDLCNICHLQMLSLWTRLKFCLLVKQRKDFSNFGWILWTLYGGHVIHAGQMRKFKDEQTCILVKYVGSLCIKSTLLDESSSSNTGDFFLQNDGPPIPLFHFQIFAFGPWSHA